VQVSLTIFTSVTFKIAVGLFAPKLAQEKTFAESEGVVIQ
jgi:hypothetical protein